MDYVTYYVIDFLFLLMKKSDRFQCFILFDSMYLFEERHQDYRQIEEKSVDKVWSSQSDEAQRAIVWSNLQFYELHLQFLLFMANLSWPLT